ncbi:MAG TPA: hypothetical protein VH496_07615 [Mycobacterium sp.]
MKGAHPEIPPELRQLAQAIVDRLDPVVRAAAVVAAGRGDAPAKCQQVWCPVCALAALAQGEQHPMLDVIAEHSVALLTVIRAILDTNTDPSPEPPPSPAPNGRYQTIPITVEE